MRNIGLFAFAVICLFLVSLQPCAGITLESRAQRLNRFRGLLSLLARLANPHKCA